MCDVFFSSILYMSSELSQWFFNISFSFSFPIFLVPCSPIVLNFPPMTFYLVCRIYKNYVLVFVGCHLCHFLAMYSFISPSNFYISIFMLFRKFPISPILLIYTIDIVFPHVKYVLYFWNLCLLSIVGMLILPLIGSYFLVSLLLFPYLPCMRYIIRPG